MTPVAEPIGVAVRVGAILDRIHVRYTIGGSIAATGILERAFRDAGGH